MKKAFTVIAVINASLCLILPILLVWGYPVARNRFPFDGLKESYPGPIHITVTSFPFGLYCQELEDNKDYIKRFNRQDNNKPIDISTVYYNSDTLFVKCQMKGEDAVSYFRVVNPTAGQEDGFIQNRIKELEETPDFSELVNRGYKHRVLNDAKGMCSYLLEPLIIPLIPILSFFFLFFFLFFFVLGFFSRRRELKHNTIEA